MMPHKEEYSMPIAEKGIEARMSLVERVAGLESALKDALKAIEVLGENTDVNKNRINRIYDEIGL